MNTMRQPSHNRTAWDMAGVSASLLCVLHCLATPLLITTLPVLAATEHLTHSVLSLVMLVIGLAAFIPGYRKHRKLSVSLTAALGLALLISATLLPENAGAILEPLLVVGGGLILISAHIRNAYWCRFCRICGDAGCHLQANRQTTAASAR